TPDSTTQGGGVERSLTETGTSVGTLGYMAPEQARGLNVDARADLFSFGAVLYEMATGKAPFHGETAATIYDALLNREPVAPTRLNPALRVELKRVIIKPLEKDRALRYQPAPDIRADLKRIERGSSPSPAATPETGRPRLRRGWVVAAIMIIAMLAAYLVR